MTLSSHIFSLRHCYSFQSLKHILTLYNIIFVIIFSNTLYSLKLIFLIYHCPRSFIELHRKISTKKILYTKFCFIISVMSATMFYEHHESLWHWHACNLKPPYFFCKSTLFSLLCFDVNNYRRQMPVFSALVLVCLRKLCQVCSAICSCSDAILPFFSTVINNPTVRHSLSPTSTSGQVKGGYVVPLCHIQRDALW